MDASVGDPYGHRGAGTCQLPLDEAEARIAEIVQQILKDG